MELKPENTLPNIKIKDAVKWQSEFSKINNEKKYLSYSNFICYCNIF